MPPAASKRAASLTAVILLTHRAKTQSLASGKLSFGGIFSQRLHFQPTQQIPSIFKYLQKNGEIKIIIHFMQALFKSVKKRVWKLLFQKYVASALSSYKTTLLISRKRQWEASKRQRQLSASLSLLSYMCRLDHGLGDGGHTQYQLTPGQMSHITSIYASI